jgi:hypothetical protein
MRGPHYSRVLAATALSLMLAAPLDAFAQDSQELPATFNERFPPDQTSTQPPSPRNLGSQEGTEPYDDYARRQGETPAVAGRRCAAVVPQR